MKESLKHTAINELAWELSRRIQKENPELRSFGVYGVPRGGVYVAYLLVAQFHGQCFVVDTPEEAAIIVDDIVDSGRTRTKWVTEYPNAKFYALTDKTVGGNMYGKGWVSFPWESSDTQETEETVEDNIVRLLQFVGEDPKRGGLIETPKRVAKAWRHWCSGYGVDIPSLLKTFEDGADGCDEMVVVKDVPFYTHCEHHMAPFFGTATIAYIPDGKIVGLSKLSRVLDVFSRRLQVQERLTNQIADALHQNLQPKGVGVLVKARHLCMESRGISKQGHITITSALRGVMRDLPEVRAEFLDLAR